MTSSLQEHFVFRSTLTSGAVLFRRFKLPFCWFLCSFFVLLKPNDDLKFLSMILYIWTNISISNWHFLIPCYHQNSQEVVLNTFCSNIEVSYMSGSMAIDTPYSGSVTTTLVFRNRPLSICVEDFGMDLVCLSLSHPDVILGMNWLRFNRV